MEQEVLIRQALSLLHLPAFPTVLPDQVHCHSCYPRHHPQTRHPLSPITRALVQKLKECNLGLRRLLRRHLWLCSGRKKLLQRKAYRITHGELMTSSISTQMKMIGVCRLMLLIQSILTIPAAAAFESVPAGPTIVESILSSTSLGLLNGPSLVPTQCRFFVPYS